MLGNEEDDSDLRWVQLAETLASQLAAREHAVALETSQHACVLAEGFGARDPRVAASLNNLGVTQRLGGDLTAADQSYRQALEQWESASEWVRQMRLTPRARSSLFHLRLENRHRATYERNARAQFSKQLTLGRTVTLNNLAELAYTEDPRSDAEGNYQRAAEECTTLSAGDDVLVQVIASNIVALRSATNIPTEPVIASNVDQFKQLAERSAWIIDRPPVFSDEGRLAAAVLCAVAVQRAGPSGG